MQRSYVLALCVAMAFAACSGDAAAPRGELVVQLDGSNLTTEAGASARITVALSAPPTGPVTIPVLARDPSEGVATPASLTFTASNWNAPQEVLVVGQNDDQADGAVPYSVDLGPAEGGQYNGKVASINLINNDDETAGVTLSAASGATSEEGMQATFTVVLHSAPTSDVALTFASSDASEGVLADAQVVFTTENWNAPQRVVVTGVNDDLQDGPQPYEVAIAAVRTTDPNYENATSAAPVTFTNIDDDTAGFIVDVDEMPTTETGGQSQFSVRLTTEPTADVVLALSSSDASEGSVNRTTLTFTSANWQAPQTVAVTGVNDDVRDGNQLWHVAFGATASSDAAYAALRPDPVNFLNLDDETAGVIVAVQTDQSSEDGQQARLTVRLQSEPQAEVRLSYQSSDASEGVASGTLSFSAQNWNAPQEILVTGQNDDLADGNQLYQIGFAPVESSDADYLGMQVAPAVLSNVDNDSAGISVSAVSGDSTERGGQAEFTVVLASQPTANVTLTLASSNVAEGQLERNELVFTPANWNAPQVVRLVGQDDAIADGNQVYRVEFAASVSDDAQYAGVVPPHVELVNVDDDSAGITVTVLEGQTSEAGGQASFAVVLNSQPRADVTVRFGSDDLSEGFALTTELVFTPSNWNAPQQVIVTGVNDDIADGSQPYQMDFMTTLSNDAAYAVLVPPSLDLVNVDNDSAGFSVAVLQAGTSEAGGQARFTVVLNSEPTAAVQVQLASDDVTEGQPVPAQLVFTPNNWNAPQEVAVAGIDDQVADGAQPYHIVFGPTVSDDAAYAALRPANVDLTNIDDDSAGITVLLVDAGSAENGDSATFSVVLNSEPTAEVVVSFLVDDATEARVTQSSVRFTPANWNAPVLVSVQGVDDQVADGNQPYQIDFAATTSSDLAYAVLVPASLDLVNTDNDSAGIVVGAVSGPTTESGGQATFSIVLTSEPTANVSMSLTVSDATEGALTPATVVFTPSNWNAPQLVRLTGVNDNVADGSQAYRVDFAAAVSADANYAGRVVASVNITNLDNDSPGITVSTISGATTETGGQATFTVVLRSEPTANVEVPFASDDTTEGVSNPTSLTFTPANWNAPQVVRVTGQNDQVADGNQPYQIDFGMTTSADPGYAGLRPASVNVVNLDNDSAGIVVSAISAATTEAGGQATFTVVLTSEPTAPVVLPLTSDDGTEGTIAVASLTFTPANWNAPQTVRVTGQNDNIADGNQPYQIDFGAVTSADTKYAGRRPASVDVINQDNDTAGIVVAVVAPTSSEAGGEARFSVVLQSEPTAEVVVQFASDDATEGLPHVTALTFTPVNWNAPQFVRVIGQNDDVADGAQPYQIDFAATTSADAAYAALTPANLNFTNTDNDSAQIVVSAVSGSTSELGATASFTVVLTSEPTADVTVAFVSDDPSEGVLDTSALLFTAANWNAPQTVTLTGQNDAVADGAQPYQVDFIATTSADATYAALLPASIDVANLDDDVAGIAVSPLSGATTEVGGTATFTLALTSEPTSDVTLHFASDDASEGVTTVTSATFSATNWNVPQTFTVSGVDDALDDGNQTYQVDFTATTSADAGYAGLTPANLNAVNLDDDTAGVTVGLPSGTTTEAGGAASIAVVLQAQPSANVTLAFASNATDEGQATVASLVFTPVTWNVPQQITIVGQNDAIDDGDQPYRLVFAVVSSADSAYQGLAIAPVDLVNLDDDTANIVVGAPSGNTTEAGGTATFTVRLASQPTTNVTMPLSSDDPGEGSISPTALTFTPSNWNTPQTITVTGVDDALDDGNITYHIVFAATVSADPQYHGQIPSQVTVVNVDNDDAQVCGVNLLRGQSSGGTARIVEQTQAAGYTAYRTTLGTTCGEAWFAFGSLCDETPDSNSQTANTKSDNNSGATWVTNNSGTGVGILVIDLGAATAFDRLQIYQMFSDGKTTHVRFATHPATGATPPPATDAGWAPITAGFELVGPGAIAGNTVTQPTVVTYASRTTRYLRVEARNDGRYGAGNYLELRALKMFSSACTNGCAGIKAAQPSAPDGVYAIAPNGVASFDVFCDMTTDGGGWTKILQYVGGDYAITANAVGTIATSANTADAKLSDAQINALRLQLGGTATYRIDGSRSTSNAYLRSNGAYVDSLPGLGLGRSDTHAVTACIGPSQCALAGVNPVAWMDFLHYNTSGAGETCNRYFTGHANGPNIHCWTTQSVTTRCFSGGGACDGLVYPGHDSAVMWMK